MTWENGYGRICGKGAENRKNREKGEEMKQLNDLIVIGLWMIGYGCVIIGGNVEGNLRIGGFLYQMGLELPRFIYWIIAIINIIVVWYITHVLGVVATNQGSLWGIFFGGLLLYALASTLEPNCVIALTVVYGFCLTVIGWVYGPWR